MDGVEKRVERLSQWLGFGGKTGVKRRHDIDEVSQLHLCCLWQLAIVGFGAQCVEKRDSFALCAFVDPSECGGGNSAPRRIDNAAQCQFVVQGIGNAKIKHGIADFGLVVELRSSDDFIG